VILNYLCSTVEKAFRCDLVNPPPSSALNSVSVNFNQYLHAAVKKTVSHSASEETSTTVPDSKVYLPYTSIVQSSGWGKSRAAVEYCKHYNIPCLYLCLRNPAHSGFPARSVHAEKNIVTAQN
jgi:hypothetical protein